jgi:hypothetical protein
MQIPATPGLTVPDHFVADGSLPEQQVAARYFVGSPTGVVTMVSGNSDPQPMP